MRRAALLSAAALLAGVIIGAMWLAPRPASSPVVRTIIPADTLVSNTDRSFAFTRDGSSLGYISSEAREIFVRPLDALEPVVILTTAAYIRGLYPSPDGRWFGYIENNFTLKKISTAGGAPVTGHWSSMARHAGWRGDRTTRSCSAQAHPKPVFSASRPAAGRSPCSRVRTTNAVRRITFSRRGSPTAEACCSRFSLREAVSMRRRSRFSIWRAATHARYSKARTPRATSRAGTSCMRRPAAYGRTRFDLSRLETQGTPVEQLAGPRHPDGRRGRRVRYRRRWHAGVLARRDRQPSGESCVGRSAGARDTVTGAAGRLPPSTACSGRQARRGRSHRAARETSTSGR